MSEMWYDRPLEARDIIGAVIAGRTPADAAVLNRFQEELEKEMEKAGETK